MSNFFIILICLLIGYLFRVFNIAGKNDYKIVNAWVIYVGLPALALLFLPKIEWNIAYVYTVALPFLLFILSYLFFNTVNRWLHLSRRTVVTLSIVSGFSNTSFVGFPLIITFFGEDHLKTGIVSDQATFFILSTFGVLLAASTKSIFSSQQEKARFIFKRLFTFPPFIACVVALLFRKVLANDDLTSFFQALAATVSPLALFSIGMQLRFKNLSKELGAISLSLIFKLILAPLLFVVLSFFIGFKGVLFKVSVFEMAMPCLVGSSIIIEKFGLNIKLSNTIIGLSVIFGLALSYIWFSVINTLL